MPAGAGSIDGALRTGGRTKQSRRPTTEDGTSGITSAALISSAATNGATGKSTRSAMVSRQFPGLRKKVANQKVSRRKLPPDCSCFF